MCDSIQCGCYQPHTHKKTSVHISFVFFLFSPGNLGKYYIGLYKLKTCLSLALTVCAQF